MSINETHEGINVAMTRGRRRAAGWCWYMGRKALYLESTALVNLFTHRTRYPLGGLIRMSRHGLHLQERFECHRLSSTKSTEDTFCQYRGISNGTLIGMDTSRDNSIGNLKNKPTAQNMVADGELLYPTFD